MIALIAAIARNRAIGFENKLLYWLPEDLKRFKALTTGNTIIMGRKTFESLPKGALPNRRNVVLSRQKLTFPGTEVYPTLEEALSSCEGQEVYIIGGASLYEQALPYADRLFLTEVDDTPLQADAFFPSFQEDKEWTLEAAKDFEPDERHAHAFHFTDYIRTPKD